MSKLDRYDLSILAELQRDARISNQELAERIGLSPSPCSRRVKQLEDDGYISRQVALLDRKMLGLSLTAYVLIGMDRHTPERFENFEAAIRTLPQVLECSLVTGMDADYQLKVVVPDMDHYQKLLLGHLTRIEGVTSVRSSFVLRRRTVRVGMHPVTLCVTIYSGRGASMAAFPRRAWERSLPKATNSCDTLPQVNTSPIPHTVYFSAF